MLLNLIITIKSPQQKKIVKEYEQTKKGDLCSNQRKALSKMWIRSSLVKWPRLDFIAKVEDEWAFFLALIPNLNLAILTPSTGSEDVRKPRALESTGQHCPCFMDKRSAAEEKECIGQHHRACRPLDVPQGHSQISPASVALLLKVWFVGSSVDVSREFREMQNLQLTLQAS